MREDLVREHSAALYRRAMALTGNGSDAGDLVQDTWLRALRKHTSAVSDPKLLAWLLVIMRNIHLDNVRKRKTRGASVTSTAVLENLPGPEPEPESERDPAWTRLSFAEIRPTVAHLAQPLRSTFELHAIERRSYDEISRLLNVPKATVGTRLMRARRRLRVALELGAATPVPENNRTSEVRSRLSVANQGRPAGSGGEAMPAADQVIDPRFRRDGRSGPRSARAVACG